MSSNDIQVIAERATLAGYEEMLAKRLHLFGVPEEAIFRKHFDISITKYKWNVGETFQFISSLGALQPPLLLRSNFIKENDGNSVVMQTIRNMQLVEFYLAILHYVNTSLFKDNDENEEKKEEKKEEKRQEIKNLFTGMLGEKFLAYVATVPDLDQQNLTEKTINEGERFMSLYAKNDFEECVKFNLLRCENRKNLDTIIRKRKKWSRRLWKIVEAHTVRRKSNIPMEHLSLWARLGLNEDVRKIRKRHDQILQLRYVFRLTTNHFDPIIPKLLGTAEFPTLLAIDSRIKRDTKDDVLNEIARFLFFVLSKREINKKYEAKLNEFQKSELAFVREQMRKVLNKFRFHSDCIRPLHPKS